MRYLWFILCLFCLCCAPAVQVPRSPAVTASANTVVILHADGMNTACAGVWVADVWILTAQHCTWDSVDMLGGEQPLTEVLFRTESKALYRGRVVYRDVEHDLGLIQALSMPAHIFARVAMRNPEVGTPVHVVGHPLGLLYTFLTGQVAQYRDSLPGCNLPVCQSPLLQLQVPIAPGSSGGGAFDNDEELVGIASMSASLLPAEGFFVPVESIREFLQKSHVL